MFRKSTITITLAAAAFVTIGSSAPADAHAIDCWLEPFHCIVDVVTEDRDRGPAEEDTTLDPGAVAGAADLDLGGILFPLPDSPSLTPGGVSTDVSPGTVITPGLPDDVLDAIMEPSVELPPVELPPIEEPAAPEATEPPAEAPPAPATTESATSTPDTGRSGETRAVAPTTVAPARVAPDASEREVRETSTTTSVAAQDETTEDQTDEAVEALIETDTSSSFDPMMAALFGMLGAVALMLLVYAAFAAGRRRN